MKFNIFRSSYKSKTDEDLMILVGAKDSAAFEELYNRYSNILLHFFYKMLAGNEQQAQDFLHDVFLKIIEKPYLFDHSKNFKTWIFQIAYNKCKNEYRRREIRNNVGIKHEIKNNMNQVSEKVDSPEETVDQKQLNKLIFTEVQKLKEEHSSTFIMRFQQGLSIKEIAEVLNCPQGTVKSRLFYATQKLLKTLKQYDPNYIGV
ncbi:RNA polymerase sigma factor [Calditrichota bacterium]